MKINKYPDGSSYAKVTDNLDILQDNEGYSFTWKVNSYQKLWELGQILDIMNWKGLSPIITIPNLIDAQADRRFASNESSGLKMVCEFLNRYDAYYQIFHPHNPEVVEALMDNVDIIDNSDFIKTVMRFIVTSDINKYPQIEGAFGALIGYKSDNLILMSSDAGGFKPLMKLCDKIGWQGETASANKSRRFINNKSDLTQGVDRDDYRGKDILIIDDISVYGGTFKGLSTLLRERNCGKLYLAVSHMTVQLLGEDPVTNYFDKVFTTNSKYDHYYATVLDGGVQPSNLEIIKLF